MSNTDPNKNTGVKKPQGQTLVLEKGKQLKHRDRLWCSRKVSSLKHRGRLWCSRKINSLKHRGRLVLEKDKQFKTQG